MRSIVFEDNSNCLRYWIFTLIITTYCMNKRGFHFCALSFYLFTFSSPCFLLLFLCPLLSRLFTLFFPFFLVSLQVSNLLSFSYLSLNSLSSTPLLYEVQLRITFRQTVFINTWLARRNKNLDYNLLNHLFKRKWGDRKGQRVRWLGYVDST